MAALSAALGSREPVPSQTPCHGPPGSFSPLQSKSKVTEEQPHSPLFPTDITGARACSPHPPFPLLPVRAVTAPRQHSCTSCTSIYGCTTVRLSDPGNTTLWQTPPLTGTLHLCEGQEGSLIPAQKNWFASQCKHRLITSSALMALVLISMHPVSWKAQGRAQALRHLHITELEQCRAVQVFPQRRVMSQRLGATGGAQEQINLGTRWQRAG